MKKNIATIYIFDNTLLFFNEKKDSIREYQLSSNTVEYGLVVNIKRFVTEFQTILKNENMTKSLFGFQLNLIIPPHFKEIHKFIWKEISELCSIKKIRYIKESTLYKKEKNTLTINISEQYLILIYQDKNKKQEYRIISKKLFQNDMNQIMKHISKNYIKNQKVYTLGKTNAEITSLIDKHKPKMNLYYENPKYHLLFRYKKLHKM